MESLNDVARGLQRVDERLDSFEERLDSMASAARLPDCGCMESAVYTASDLKAATNGGVVVGVLLAYLAWRYLLPLVVGGES